jgi:hypothetical protein
MATGHGKKTKVYANGLDLTSFFHQFSSPKSRDTAETTTFGQEDKTYVAGQRDATLSLSGRFEGQVDAVDEELNAALGGDSPYNWNVFPQGDVLGNAGFGMQALANSYDVEGPVDGVVDVAAELQSIVGRERLLSHHALGAETIDGSFTAIDGGAATTNGGVGYLQVTAFSGFSGVIVYIEDSADGSTDWQPIITFTTVAAAKAHERIAISGTVRRHTRCRVDVTGSGSVTFMAAFGRK